MKKKSIIKEDEKNNKKKQSKIIQQKIKNKKIISHSICKLNIYFIVIFAIIFLISFSYYIGIIFLTKKLKHNYMEFDSNIDAINDFYLKNYQIFIQFKEQLEKFEKTGNKSDFEIPSAQNLIGPKLNNSLNNLMKYIKNSEQTITMFNNIYEGNACEILIEEENEKKRICQNILSTLITKGFEQVVNQINSILITNVIDDLQSLKINRTIYDIYNKYSIFIDYELFINYFMFLGFLKTQTIFDEFRKNQKIYIQNNSKIFLFLFFIIYIFLFIFLIIYIYSYKTYTGCFLSFIGIVPPKFLADDKEFYSQVIGLDPFYF